MLMGTSTTRMGTTAKSDRGIALEAGRESEAKAALGRVLSIDVLRGFDMLLIVGGGSFIVLLEGQTGVGWVDWLAVQLRHPEWNGFTFYDFIFPFFLFISGVSLSYSLGRGIGRGMSKSALHRKAFVRMLILIGLGILDKNIPVPVFEPSLIRYCSVLGRIGIATFFGALIFLNARPAVRLIWVAAILLTYYAALFLVPVPGYGAGDLSFEGNLVGWIDRTFMPGRLLQTTYDELGLLTQFPAVCLTVLGTLAGDLLRSDRTDSRKITWLAGTGVLGILFGLVWNLHFPINKHLWSSSFVLLTAGMASLALMLCYWIIDVLKFRRWSFFLEVIGVNALTIYLLCRFVDFPQISDRLLGGLYAPVPAEFHPAFAALGGVLIVWSVLAFLHRRRIFFKI